MTAVHISLPFETSHHYEYRNRQFSLRLGHEESRGVLDTPHFAKLMAHRSEEKVAALRRRVPICNVNDKVTARDDLTEDPSHKAFKDRISYRCIALYPKPRLRISEIGIFDLTIVEQPLRNLFRR